ncbi:hypothetical protein GALMADRAFT_258745 [Galerina marginata CBS 339.88]|uniref:F-box domain-containing protein n=1 Tax=Galerina marginata (strain CBS 339.88) TaxID=685588 RepID=A0A067S7R1_GALM3|nr:hypothetical protein GALMADRAFT_258745 [Galerina marginata CBS 339.88]
MASNSRLPLEVVLTVLDILAQDDQEFLSLKACSFVCKTFLHQCRKHIFASISVDGRKLVSPKPNTTSLIRLLSTTPEIADHIRKLVCCITREEFDRQSLPGVLEKINKLEFLSIRWPGLERRWNHNPLRPALLHLLHLPTLVHLELRKIEDFEVLDFLPCTNLKELDFSVVKAVESEGASYLTCSEDPIRLRRFSAGWQWSTTISKLCRTIRPDGRLIIDFANVTSVSFHLYERDEHDAAAEFFKHCEQVTDVVLHVYSPPLTWMGISKTLAPSMQTLTRLSLNISRDESGTADPLSGLVDELKGIRHQNCIESIIINVYILPDWDCSSGDDWGRLDEELTQPGWPKLKSVLVGITVFTLSREANDLEMALRKLPETQFPRLSSSKSVVFEFSVAKEFA